jgi:hypothetical protein
VWVPPLPFLAFCASPSSLHPRSHQTRFGGSLYGYVVAGVEQLSERDEKHRRTMPLALLAMYA